MDIRKGNRHRLRVVKFCRESDRKNRIGFDAIFFGFLSLEKVARRNTKFIL